MESAATSRSNVEQLREKATQVRDDIRDLGSIAKDVASEKFDQYYKQGRERIVQFSDTVESRIRERPLQSIAIAAGVGFLAGYLFSSRRR